MKFDILSIIFIIIILIAVIIGIKKGMFKILIKIIKDIFSWVLAVFLCKPLTNLLINSLLGNKLTLWLSDKFLNKGGSFALVIDETNKVDVVTHSLESFNLPDFINSFAIDILSEKIIINEPVVVAEALGKTIAYYSLMLISCLLIFIIVRIIVALISKLFKAILQVPVFSFVNKLLGGALSGIIGLAIVCGISYVITLLMPFNEAFATWISNTIMLDDPNVFTFSKFIYQNNLLLMLITFIQGLFI